MPDYGDPDPALVDRLRPICLALPDAFEESAWVGTRWKVRTRTFAHVLAVDDATTVTFRAAGDELDFLRRAGPPFRFLGWGRNAIGLALDEHTDWTEVAELLTESYCVMAPKRLAAQVERPPER